MVEHRDARQRLAFQRFKKRAAGGRYVGEAGRHRSRVQCRHRIAAAREADKLSGGGEFRHRLGHLDGAVVERLQLESAERAVPDQRFWRGRSPRSRARRCAGRCPESFRGADRISRDDAGRRERGELLRNAPRPQAARARGRAISPSP